MTVENIYHFNDLDSLMEEHFWMWTKLTYYKEKYPEKSVTFKLEILIGDQFYYIKSFISAKESQEDNRSDVSRV